MGELNTERGYGNDPDATVYVLDWKKPVAQQSRYVRYSTESDSLHHIDASGKITQTVLVRQ